METVKRQKRRLDSVGTVFTWVRNEEAQVKTNKPWVPFQEKITL